MDALIDTARRRGLRRMEGVILPANRKMTKFARQLGFTLRREPSDPTTLRAVRPL
jgi:acetyltransferase